MLKQRQEKIKDEICPKSPGFKWYKIYKGFKLGSTGFWSSVQKKVAIMTPLWAKLVLTKKTERLKVSEVVDQQLKLPEH